LHVNDGLEVRTEPPAYEQDNAGLRNATEHEEKDMPHVVIKMYAGRSEEQKQRLSEEIARTVTSVLGSSEASVSVAIEDIEPARWTQEVYEPDIDSKRQTLYKKPGY
jgi:4-oxalocrotonate tautomerase